MQINHLIEYTRLSPQVTVEQFEKLCSDALEYRFKGVCIPPLFVKLCKQILIETSINVSAVIGYPYGYSAIEAKLAEILLSIVDGADEVEVMVNCTAIKNKDWKYVSDEFIHLLQVVEGSNKPLTIIIESGYLTNEEIVQCCHLYGAANIKAIKTSTGLFTFDSMHEKITLMRKNLPEVVEIKAFGHINDYTTAVQLIKAGASIIGTEQGPLIMKEFQKLNNFN